MFIWIDNGKHITAINKKCIRFFFIWITRKTFDFDFIKMKYNFSEIIYHVLGY